MKQFFLKNLYRLSNKHFLSLFSNGLMSVLGYVLVALLTRSVSISDFGVWVFFQTCVLLVDTFRSGFITTAFIKFYSGASPDKTKEIIGSTWYLCLLITLALTLLTLPALFFLDQISNEGLKLFFKWFAVFFWSMLPYFVASCVVQADQRFDRLLYLRIINQLLFIVCIIGLILFGRLTVITTIYSYLISFLIPSILVLVNGWAQAKYLNRRTKDMIMELYHFGKYSVGTTISSNLFRTSDSFIINFILGPASLGIYNIGQSLLQIVEIPLRSFAATVMPMLAAEYNSNNKPGVIDIMKKYTGMLTAGLLPVCLAAILLADIGVALIGGGKYAHTDAANVFRMFMTFALLYPADRFMALTLDVIHKPKVNFIKVLVMLAANVVFDLLFIKLFKNIYGVALATVIPTLIAVGVGYVALQDYSKFSLWSIFKDGYKDMKDLLLGYIR